jgi:hypothetical protein
LSALFGCREEQSGTVSGVSESLSFNVYRTWRYENVVLHNRAMIAWSMSFATRSVLYATGQDRCLWTAVDRDSGEVRCACVCLVSCAIAVSWLFPDIHHTLQPQPHDERQKPPESEERDECMRLSIVCTLEADNPGRLTCLALAATKLRKLMACKPSPPKLVYETKEWHCGGGMRSSHAKVKSEMWSRGTWI